MRAEAIFFVLAVSGTIGAYALHMRSMVVESQKENVQLKVASAASAAAVDKLQAEIRIRDSIIAERDGRIAELNKKTDALLGELERIHDEDPIVAAWGCADIPDAVRRLLQDGVCPTGYGSQNPAADGTAADGGGARLQGKD